MNKTPKLRFKEFSGKWSTCKAKDLFESISDKNHNGNLEVLSATQDRGVIPRSELNIDIKFEKNNLTSYKKVKKSDFIISLRSFQGGIEHSYYTGLVSPAYTVFNFKHNIDLNHKFFAQIFKTRNFINRLNTLTYGIRDGKAISFKDFSDVKLSFPSNEEQEKIVSFLYLIDKKISLQSEKVEMLKEYKKGMMQKIFSRALRFKDDSGRDYPEWEEKKLGNICNITTGKLNANAMVENGKYRFYTCAKEYYYIDRYAFDTNALLISGNGACVGYIHHYNGKFNAYQRTYVLDSFEEDILYIKAFLEEYLGKRITYCKNEGNTPYIVLDTLTEMKIQLPSLCEQEKIASFSSTLNKKIEKEQEKLDSLNEYKKGLLQQMFV